VGKAMVFIDGSNLYYSLKNETGDTALDFQRLGEKLAQPEDLHTVYYYNAPMIERVDPAKYRRQQRFFDALHNTNGVIVRLGRLVRKGGTFVEKGVDVLIAADMLSHAFRGDYDTAVLVSGDGDFAVVVEAITRQGRIVKNAAFKNARSDALVKVCHTFIELTAGFLSDCRP
jgi:uncharacterized LabA/DUF88 family protein